MLVITTKQGVINGVKNMEMDYLIANMTVEEYEEYFDDRVATLNSMIKDKGFEFTLYYAYDGVRLCKRRIGSSGESDLSCRFFYEQDEYETSNYEAFKDMLNTLINVLMALKD